MEPFQGLILVEFFILTSLIRLTFSVGLFRSVGYYYNTKKSSNKGVTIIVCAKNEFENLQVLIPLLLHQTYTNKEVIIVDDHSTDNTHTLINNYEGVVWLSPDNDLPGKKNALSQGIKSANNDWVLLTDADCIPTIEWAKTMMDHKQDNDIVLGYSPMLKGKSTVNLFSRYETLLTALQYLSFAIKGIPYMGVGRNLLYRKSVFEKIGGFESHKNIVSGDDDLLIQSALQYGKIGVCLEDEAYVYSHTKQSWLNYIKQKMRHISTSFHYKAIHQILLTIFALTHILWVGLLFYCILTGTAWLYIGVIVVIFWVITLALQYKSIMRLREWSLLPVYPLLDISMGFYYVIVGFSAAFGNKSKNKTWN